MLYFCTLKSARDWLKDVQKSKLGPKFTFVGQKFRKIKSENVHPTYDVQKSKYGVFLYCIFGALVRSQRWCWKKFLGVSGL